MCDTLSIVTSDHTWFAKNSDRPIGEAQVVERFERRPVGNTLRTQYLELPDAGAHALVGSRPAWLWGLEHGVNEHSVAVGNERVWTTDQPMHTPALIGMDLVRLALERARSAEAAVSTITDLLDDHGQGGSCAQDRDDPYYSTFLVADPGSAWVLETTGPSWATRKAPAGAAISNRLTLRSDWDRSSPDLTAGQDVSARNDPLSPLLSDQRLVHTCAEVGRGAAADARSLAALLRHHGDRTWGAPGDDPANLSPPPDKIGDDFSGVTICQHVDGVAVTAASMIAELVAGQPPRLFVSLGSPCASLFVPVGFDAVPAALGDIATWQRFDRLRAAAESDAGELAAIRAVLAPLEAELWAEAEAGGPSLDAWGLVDSALATLGV